MTTLVESPSLAIFVGIAVEAVLGIVLLKTGRGVILLVMLGVLAVVLALVGLEWLVVTDAERVEETLDRAAAALQAGDLVGVLDCCHPTAAHSRSEARRALEWIEFTKVKITDLKVSINRLTSPPSARAEGLVVVSGHDRHGSFEEMTRPIRFQVELRQQGERWLVTGHSLDSAPGGF